MAVSLLLTKFYQPTTHPKLVSRSGLVRRLNEGLFRGSKLTLVAAPAGFGKTTLITDWLKQADRPFVWLSLDEGDNDPLRFFTYVLAALQTIKPDIAPSVQSILDSRQLTPAGQAASQSSETGWIHTLMTAFINDLTKGSTPLILVLDDYHLISRESIHEAVQFLVEHQPPAIHLVMITREDPPLMLPRMRVRSEITEIRERDLRFSEKEAAEFLTGTMGLKLSAKDVAILDVRTEGWIAGLQMMALSLEGQDEARMANLIETFSGTHHYVIDYLAEEVLRRQSPALQEFICQTSILDRMSASLCDAVTERNDSKSILVRLVRSNLFLIALDERREWYRYHHLFRDFLRTRVDPDQQAPLHHKAALWYEQNGLIDKAVEHSLKAGDLKEAERVIAIACRQSIQEGQLVTMLGWLNSLPDERIRANGELATFKGWALCLTGQREAAETYARCAEKWLTADERPSLLAELWAFQAYLAVQRGDNTNALNMAQKALSIMEKDDFFFKSVFHSAALLSLGHAQRELGETQAAIEAFRRVYSSTQAYGDHLGTMGALEELVLLLYRHGRRREAEVLCQQTIARCVGAGSEPLPMLGIVYIGLAMMSYEADDLIKANETIRQGLELSQQLMMPTVILRGKILQARLFHTMGKDQLASNAINKAREIAAQFGSPRYTRLAESSAAELYLLQGKLAAAAGWAETASLSLDDVPSAAREAEYLVFSRLLLAQKRFVEADRLLVTLEELAQERERYGRLISIYVLRALVKHGLGSETEALDYLERALWMAAPRGYYRAFLDAGSSLVDLLFKARPAAPVLVDRLLGSMSAGPEQLSESEYLLVEPLSERELEVLRLVASGLSNQEASQVLYVTEGTVKKHLSHIFDKLEVKNRTQAVSRAKELGLLV